MSSSYRVFNKTFNTEHNCIKEASLSKIKFRGDIFLVRLSPTTTDILFYHALYFSPVILIALYSYRVKFLSSDIPIALYSYGVLFLSHDIPISLYFYRVIFLSQDIPIS